jgi:hypothetical protein
VLLNESQRRHLGVTLSQMQRLLHEIDALVQSSAPQNGLVTEADDVPGGFARTFTEKLALIDGRIAALANRFDLPRREQSRFRWVRAVLGTSIDNLEDTRAKNLRAYGPVHPALADVLDPELLALQEQLRALLAALEWSGRA